MISKTQIYLNFWRFHKLTWYIQVVLFGEGPYASSDFCETSVKYRSRTEICMVSKLLCTRAKSREKIRHGNETKISAYVFKRILY